MICSHNDCARDGTKMPVLLLHPPAPLPGEARVDLGLLVCPEHQATTTLDELLGDEAWKMILAVCHVTGRVEPDRSRTTFEWVEPDPHLFEGDTGHTHIH